MLYKLIPLVAEQFKNVFPELDKQKDFIGKVVHEEERNFLRTLASGLLKIGFYFQDIRKQLNDKKHELGFGSSTDINNIIVEPFDLESNLKDKFKIGLSGKTAFDLYDTYGFPIDLTKLIASENNFAVDEEGFEKEMLQQKNRSRTASVVDTEDWIIVNENGSSKFVGYDSFETESKILKYRKTKSHGKESFQIVLDKTSFYAESGGQVGDTGILIFDDEKIAVINTKKENDLIIHFTEKLPVNIDTKVIAKIDVDKRKKTAVHHSATHLMHAALRKVLGTHVQQKGSLVNDEYLRFDFSHFSKLTNDEIAEIDYLVNEKIREDIPVTIKEMPKEEAMASGAMALFGEKYGEKVRVVTIDPVYSIELCGGTHIGRTGELGFFKIITETAVGAGLRRIEALSGKVAEDYINNQSHLIQTIRETLKNPKDINKGIENLIVENAELKKQLEKFETKQLSLSKNELIQKVEKINGINFIGQVVEAPNADSLKKICFSLKNELKNYVIVLTADVDGKANVAVMLDESIVSSKKMDAAKIIKEYIAPLIKGGGGGQKTLATAGGQDVSRFLEVIQKVKSLL